MTQFSSVIAGRVRFRIQRGDNTGWAFRWKRDGVYTDWLQYPGVKMDFSCNGRIVMTHNIGDGLAVHSDPTYLKFRPWGSAGEKDLPPGPVEFDIKVPMTDVIARYPVRGEAEIIDNITK